MPPEPIQSPQVPANLLIPPARTESPIGFILNGLARPGILPPRLYPDDEIPTRIRNSCILDSEKSDRQLSDYQPQPGGIGDPERWNPFSAEKMLQDLDRASDSARTFGAFVCTLHQAGYTLSATKRGVTVSHGQNDWSDRDPRCGHIHGQISWYFGGRADFTPGTLAHKYLALRLLWIEKTGFEHDLDEVTLLTLRGPLQVLKSQTIWDAVETVFTDFPEAIDRYQRCARFKKIVFEALAVHRREHGIKT